MTLGEMINTLRTARYERVEIRDDYGNEILTCKTSGLSGWETYKDCKVVEWFPHGAPNKDATFTVYVRYDAMKGGAE